MNLIRITRQEPKKKAGSTIFHVETGGQSFFFGSIAAIFATFRTDELGVSQSYLYDYGITPDHPYQNRLCKISKSELHRKKGGRTLPK